MQEYPLVSIVTPSYNQGRFIEETILSVLNQDYPNIEYIVMDGGSTDETLEILKKYNDRLIWISDKDGGQTDAINKGLQIARGEILAYLNSDDTYLPGAIRKAVHYLVAEKPESKFVYGEGYHISDKGEIIDRYPTESFNLERLAETCFICQPTTFWKREVIDAIGFFNDDLNYAMDYDYWIRLAFKYKNLNHINDFLANSRFYLDTKTLSKSLEVHTEILTIVKKHYGKGNVPLTWIYAFAHFFMDKVIKREGRIKNIIYVFGITSIVWFKFLQFNKMILLSEIPLWVRWYIDAVFYER